MFVLGVAIYVQRKGCERKGKEFRLGKVPDHLGTPPLLVSVFRYFTYQSFV